MPERFVPRVYQERLVQEMVLDARHGGFADPGLGKTASQLLALQEADAFPALVIAPLRVCYSTWPEEIEKWSNFHGLRTSILHGKGKGAALKADADLYLVNPEGLPWLFGKPDLKRKKWLPGRWQSWRARPQTLVVDELHNFKRSTGTRSKTLKRFLGDFERRHGLTGTPIPNGMMDLHGQLLVLDQGEALDPRITYYQKRYFVPVPLPGRQYRVKWELRPGAYEEILEKIAPRVTSLRAADWLDLPDLVVTEVPVPIPEKAMKVYEEIKVHGTVEALDLVVNEDVGLNKRRQVANGFVYDELGTPHPIHTAKDDALLDLLDQIGAPTMVVYEFKPDRERLRKLLKGRRFAILGGGTGAEEGARIAKRWNAGELDVLVTHPESGGVGLNLQGGGRHMIWLSPTWDLKAYIQTVGRLFRQGQVAAVMVYLLCAVGTLDYRASKVLKKKDATEEDFMNALREELDA